MSELFYCRNPGDARVKVGSDREVASSPCSPKPGVVKIGYTTIGILRGGGERSKIGPVIGAFTPINSPILRWDWVAQRAPTAIVNVISAKGNGKRPSSAGCPPTGSLFVGVGY